MGGKNAKSSRAGRSSQGVKSADPLLGSWQKTLNRHRAEAAIYSADGSVERTFGDIEVAAMSFLRQLEQFEPGEVIAVQIGNQPGWPSILLACLHSHLVTLPLDQSLDQSKTNSAIEVCRASAVITEKMRGRNQAAAEDKLTISLTKRSGSPPLWGENRPSLIKLTSGTTAAPRAIRFQSKQLLADCEQICDTMGITGNDVNFGVVPVSHSYGFSNLLTPLLVRGVPIVLSRDPLPRAVLNDIHRSKATVFPGMPLFYQAFCEMTSPIRPASLRLCISAGAPLPGKTAKDFQEKFGMPIHSFYGSSECGGICYDRNGNVYEDGFVGAALAGVEIELLEQKGPSRIRVRSAAVGDDYFPATDRTKLGNGIFVPDDLLTPRGHATFKIVGRTSDLINVAGRKVNPAEVEAELMKLPGVEQAIVFGRKSQVRNEEIAACVVARPGISETHLLSLCRSRMSEREVPKRIFIVEQLPVNERGKLSRRDLARVFADR